MIFKAPSFFCSVRFVVTIMAFFGYCLQYMLKINLGIAIVCMVNSTALNHMKPTHHIEGIDANVSTDLYSDQTNKAAEVMCLFKESSGHKMVTCLSICHYLYLKKKNSAKGRRVCVVKADPGLCSCLVLLWLLDYSGSGWLAFEPIWRQKGDCRLEFDRLHFNRSCAFFCTLALDGALFDSFPYRPSSCRLLEHCL